MPERPLLDALDQRILGSLLEKQRTVPASYPLSLTALRTACNQATSREPVTDHSEAELSERARDLKARGLLRVVWAGKGSRVLKYHQLLTETLDLDDEAAALLTVMLLRGEQTAGELRVRTERLHPFADREAVEAALRRLASGEMPLVRELDRRPGEKDNRWVHLLAAETAASVAPSAADPEAVLADGAAARDARVLAARALTVDEPPDAAITHPFEEWLLWRVPAIAGSWPVAHLGCGRGDLTARLASDGAAVVGFDDCPELLDAAAAAHPEVEFQRASLAQFMRPRTADGWGAIVAWFSLTHLAPSELPAVFATLQHTLRPGGWALIALFAGEGVDAGELGFDVVLHDPHAVTDAAASAGLRIAESYILGGDGATPERLYLIIGRDADA